MWVEPPSGEKAKDATEDGSGANLGGSRPFKEADYDLSKGPRDHAHRAWKMPKDERAYIEMMNRAMDDDDDGEDTLTGGRDNPFDPVDRERQARFRAAAKMGTNCGGCGKLLTADEPVWRIRRQFDGARLKLKFSHHVVYETENIVAPVCRQCWDGPPESRALGFLSEYASRIAFLDACNGCGRTVHVTAKALKSWLAHGRKVYCCEGCIQRPKPERTVFTKICQLCGESFAPKRLDARFCKSACRVAAGRKNKSA
jgi:hypothetical protein